MKLHADMFFTARICHARKSYSGMSQIASMSQLVSTYHTFVFGHFYATCEHSMPCITTPYASGYSPASCIHVRAMMWGAMEAV